MGGPNPKDKKKGVLGGICTKGLFAKGLAGPGVQKVPRGGIRAPRQPGLCSRPESA